jgi:CheY-like chemotaxis protein
MMTLLLVDDSPAFRAVARQALGAAFRIVGEATDGAEALELARSLAPDVVLLDVQLPVMDGVDVARALAAGDDRPAVIFTSSLDRRDIDPLLDGSMALGFIPKESLSAAAMLAFLS